MNVHPVHQFSNRLQAPARKMMSDDPAPMPCWLAVDPSYLQVVDYEVTQQQLDPTAAPEKQAKVALDGAIASGNVDQLKTVLCQIGQHIPQNIVPLLMHSLRSAAKQRQLGMMQVLLEQIQNFEPSQVFEVMKYGLDGAATQDDPGILDFLLGAVQKAFQTAYPQQFLQLIQHAVNTAAEQGNLKLFKFLLDHTSAATIPINYDDAFRCAAAKGHAETLLKEAIRGGAHYENVIMTLLQSARSLPDNNESSLGSRLSIKNTAKLQLVKSYKQSNPELFAKLMAAVKGYFPEEAQRAQNGVDGDIMM